MEQALGRNCDNLFQAVGFLYLFLDIHLSVAVFNTRVVEILGWMLLYIQLIQMKYPCSGNKIYKASYSENGFGTWVFVIVCLLLC